MTEFFKDQIVNDKVEEKFANHMCQCGCTIILQTKYREYGSPSLDSCVRETLGVKAYCPGCKLLYNEDGLF